MLSVLVRRQKALELRAKQSGRPPVKGRELVRPGASRSSTILEGAPPWEGPFPAQRLGMGPGGGGEGGGPRARTLAHEAAGGVAPAQAAKGAPGGGKGGAQGTWRTRQRKGKGGKKGGGAAAGGGVTAWG